MADDQKTRKIEISEICRVEGHSAVHVEIEDGKVTEVKLDVFEGTRFFERLIVGHHQEEIPHITSRVCAICSTGHVIAAIRAVEKIAGFVPNSTITLLRELMHLGMIIESNATHIYALALPDFLGFNDVHQFATVHQEEFKTWSELRALGGLIQTVIGGRPFHPVNLHVGGFSKYPSISSLTQIETELRSKHQLAVRTCEILLKFPPVVRRTSEPVFFALVPESERYGYFGTKIRSTTGFECDVDDYKSYLKEEPVPHSHSKRSSVNGQPIMVGSMARLSLFSDRLSSNAKNIYQSTALARGDNNTIWNNLAQAIEIVEAFDRAIEIIGELLATKDLWDPFETRQQSRTAVKVTAGSGCGTVECPRGTLYHYYSLDEKGKVIEADMITPSAQNTYRIERDIQEVVDQSIEDVTDTEKEAVLQKNLETLVRAYDPCNTCATHMVSVRVLN
jgi:sulfhydrogenase subunit alpha